MEIRGVILAGGEARRMGGGDKGLLSFGSGCLLDAVIARFDPQVADLAINANGDATRLARFGLPVLADSTAQPAGPLGGVLAALDWAAATGGDRVVTVAADTPFLPADLVPQLFLAAEMAGCDCAIAASADAGGEIRDHPTFGLWPVSQRDALRAALEGGLRRMRDWALPERTARAVFPSDRGDPFFNINRPEDLDRARTLLAGREPSM
ncbi:molybdenum cofactor guanylyltransferase MobA [Pseudooceanicola algae]|uniref:Molybdenum cofactor guanylyltransferase n=1 Tax=Pseudooceanicola algae TaxID=1537215 RepID=A0A418SKN2_9RHOB|nr:Molybdenum cofactor guanylyltransferase [Pseudooceanicola algae]